MKREKLPFEKPSFRSPQFDNLRRQKIHGLFSDSHSTKSPKAFIVCNPFDYLISLATFPSIVDCDGDSERFRSTSLFRVNNSKGKSSLKHVRSFQRGLNEGFLSVEIGGSAAKPPPWPDPADFSIRQPDFKAVIGRIYLVWLGWNRKVLCKKGVNDKHTRSLEMDHPWYYPFPVFVRGCWFVLSSLNPIFPANNILRVRCGLDQSALDKGKAPMGFGELSPTQTKTRINHQNSVEKPAPEGVSPPDDGIYKASLKGRRSSLKPIVENLKTLFEDVQKSISIFSQNTLYTTTICDLIGAKEFRKRIKMEWSFLYGGFQLLNSLGLVLQFALSKHFLSKLVRISWQSLSSSLTTWFDHFVCANIIVVGHAGIKVRDEAILYPFLWVDHPLDCRRFKCTKGVRSWQCKFLRMCVLVDGYIFMEVKFALCEPVLLRVFKAAFWCNYSGVSSWCNYSLSCAETTKNSFLAASQAVIIYTFWFRNKAAEYDYLYNFPLVMD